MYTETEKPTVLFARLLYSGCQPHQVAFIWADLLSKVTLRHRKLLFHAILDGQECTASIVPHGNGYQWTHNEATGYTGTFHAAWKHLPDCITRPLHYTDTPAVQVPSLAAPTLETLWRTLPRVSQIAIAPAHAPAHGSVL